MYQEHRETQLLSRLKEGCTDSFDEIYRCYSKPLYIYLLPKLKDPEICNDVLQDLFINLWERKADLNIRVSLEAYLYQSARYKVIDIYRNNAHFQSYMDDLTQYVENHYPDMLDTLHHQWQLQKVISGIQELPLRMKEVFVASRFEYLTIKQIATKYKISPQTVKNQLSKALQILRLHHPFVAIIVYLLFHQKV